MKKILPLLVLFLAIAFVGCYDANDFVNPVYNCECGTMTYNGTELPLKMAEAIVPDSANPLSRRYHLVADLRSDAEYGSPLESLEPQALAHEQGWLTRTFRGQSQHGCWIGTQQGCQDCHNLSQSRHLARAHVVSTTRLCGQQPDKAFRHIRGM